MLGATGSAVVEVKLDLALASELGEVALGGGAADSDLFGDVRGRQVVRRGVEQLPDAGHGRSGLALGQRRRPAEESVQRVDVVLLGLVDALDPPAQVTVGSQPLFELGEA